VLVWPTPAYRAAPHKVAVNFRHYSLHPTRCPLSSSQHLLTTSCSRSSCQGVADAMQARCQKLGQLLCKGVYSFENLLKLSIVGGIHHACNHGMRPSPVWWDETPTHKLWATAQHSTSQHITAQHSTSQHITAQHSIAQHSTAQHSTAQHSTAQHSTAQHSTAQHSTAQHSTAQHSTAQHSTAQHSTAQHSTAQHSTAQHTCRLHTCQA
jgi:hypothetical protein